MDAPTRFFSIIVPAHNEADYIADTLEHLKALDYPGDHFEVLVVENGSTDNTLTLAKSFAGGPISVFSSEKRGVSAARNVGINHMNPATGWVIFLDADTHLAPTFLRDLNAYLATLSEDAYTVGTTSLLPFPSSWSARLWYRWYDLGHKLTKTSMSMFMVRASVLTNTRFDETMRMGEDLKMIMDARAEGKFFFFNTRSVTVSTRRFEKEGWWKIFFSWTFIALLPERIQRRMEYKVIR